MLVYLFSKGIVRNVGGIERLKERRIIGAYLKREVSEIINREKE